MQTYAHMDALRSAPGTTMPPHQRLLALLRGESTILWVAVVYSVVIGLLSLVVPVAVQSLVNTVAFGALLQPLVVLTLFVFIALGFSAAMNAMRAYVVELLQRSVFAKVARDFTYRLLHARDDHGPEIVNRFFDVVTVQKAAAMLLIDGLNILMQTVIGMILVALYHPLLLAYDVLLVMSMLFILLVLGRGAVSTAIKESKAKYALAAWLEEIATHFAAFKSPDAGAFAAQRSEDLLDEYLKYREKHFRVLLRQIIGTFALQAVASAVLLGIGGYLVIARQLTLGQLVAAELVVTLMVSGFTKFGKHLEIYYDLLAALDKLGNVIDLPLERKGGEAQLAGTGPLEVDGPYNADVLYGLRPPSGGVVTLNGVDIRDLPLAELRRHAALVSGIEIFPGTILENVRMGRPLSHQDICTLLDQLGLLGAIQALPQGLNTTLHPSGRPLTRHQATRLMLARAMAGNPRLLIVEDAGPVPQGPWTVVQS